MQWFEDNTLATDVLTEVATGSNSLPEAPESIKRDIAKVVSLYGVNGVCITAIFACESSFDSSVCNKQYGCYSGQGLGQLIPSRVKECSLALKRKIDPHNQWDNIECSAYLLKKDGPRHWGTVDSWWGSYSCWHDYCK